MQCASTKPNHDHCGVRGPKRENTKFSEKRKLLNKMINVNKGVNKEIKKERNLEMFLLINLQKVG